MDVKWLPRDIFLPALEEEEFVVEASLDRRLLEAFAEEPV
jgi:hypothetical protein